LKKKWKNILSEEKRPIIGINWQGNPNTEKNTQIGRSFPLETFSTLVKNSSFKFLSLQKGFGTEQLDDCSFKNKFVQCQPQIDSTWDFLENAAIIENCDLIITSDTSVAHLAGGMGKQTWLLLKHIPEWRWGIDSDKSFWYPSMKLFRQKERSNWREVMERVSEDICYGGLK
jgi:ADP-heptose:LPS heptosyltransferase